VKHSGKALLAALRLIGLSGVAMIALLAVALLAEGGSPVFPWLAGALVALWVVFVAFTLYFFRDPDPLVPAGENLVLAPGHGKVDVIGTTTEKEFMGGECQRVSIFLSVFDVHVQSAPVAGRVAFFKHTPGRYLSALKAESARFNENVLIGLEAAEPRGERIGVRLIAGVLARRIVPWLGPGDAVQRGERISLIQFGSRLDVYLPLRARIKVKLGDKVAGGETAIAAFS
jgi:phosphatidylserine decarboxylase